MYNPDSPDNSLGFWLKQAQHGFHTRMEEALLGPDPTAERRLAVAFFLAACNAPARPDLRAEESIEAATIHASIVSLGRHLLG